MMDQLSNSVTPTTLYENYGIYYRPFWQNFYFLLFCGVVGVCILVLIVRWIRKTFFASKPPVVTAWDQAYTELNLLEKKVMILSQEQRLAGAPDFYTALTGIVKKYLKGRFGYVLEDKTDQEIILFLPLTNLPEPVREALHDFFEKASSIKFTNQVSAKVSFDEEISRLRSVIQATLPTESTTV